MTQTAEEFGVYAFQRFLDQRRLVGASCQGCQRLYVPPRSICPVCQGSRMAWRELRGQGYLAGYTAIHVVPSTMLAQGYGRDNPYLTGIVALEEGPRVSARLVGMDPKQPEQIKIGRPLQVTFVEEGQDDNKRVILAFQPVARSGR